MLSRIANSLFWLGRYIERSEHLARYTKVHYFSVLDAPKDQNKEELLMSILKYTGLEHLYFKDYAKIEEQPVLFYVLLDLKNPYSIVSAINYSRENARGCKDSITTELWEAINTYYHEINEEALEIFKPEHTFQFTQRMLDNTARIRGIADNTMIHDVSWDLLHLGFHIERAIQVMRIIITKTDDISKITKNSLDISVQNYYWSTLLKSAESFDMCNRMHKAMPSQENSLDFLILNDQFPKSILFNLERSFLLLKNLLSFRNDPTTEQLIFEAGKLLYSMKYQSIEEIMEQGVNKYLNAQLSSVYKLARQFENEYLSL